MGLELEVLGTREGFNRASEHLDIVGEIFGEFQKGYNLADLINQKLISQQLRGDQVAPILSVLLVDKLRYFFQSFNMLETVTKPDHSGVFSAWKAVDLVLSYHHPEQGLLVINPKNPASWALLDELKKYEMLTVWAGFGADNPQQVDIPKKAALARMAVEKAVAILKGSKIKPPAELLSGPFAFKPLIAPSKVKTASASGKAKAKAGPKPKAAASAPAKVKAGAPKAEIKAAPAATPVPPVAPAAPRAGQMTRVGPFGVVVTNELFHNGNVEAWKRIIYSYLNKYPNYQVYVYYDGEIIHDLNSLFKWGKVKHGTAILVAISGPDAQLKDVSKLRRYLSEGASPRFEQFLKGLPGKDLGLF